MPYPNTLIFVDLPSTDPAASAAFYEAVFGWEVEPRPEGVFHRIVPGQNFQLDDGSPGPEARRLESRQ
jgi:predicted enzyme related to lactoylglutathione lyase